MEIIPKTRRKSKTNQLEEEIINLEIYKSKCGFTCKRPGEWLLAIENYTNTVPGVNSRCQYKEVGGKYTECMITFYVTKKITIYSFLKTGVLMIQGTHYKEFANTIFPKLKNKVNNKNDSDIGSHYAEEAKEEDEIEGNEKTREEEVLANIDNLWIRNEELESAIATQDDVIKKIINRCQDIELKTSSNNVKTMLPQIMLDIERKYDDKLTVFMKAITDDVEQKNDRIKSSFKDKINDILHRNSKYEG